MNKEELYQRSARKVALLPAVFFLGSLSLLPSCKKEETTIGERLQRDSLSLTTTDTFTLITYSEEVGVIKSDERSVSLLGAYSDPVFGQVDCGFVTQVRLSSVNPLFADDINNVVVDSVVLGLSYTGINYYANLADITVEVYEIAEDIFRENTDYYTDKSIATKGVDHTLPDSRVLTPDFFSTPVVGGDTLSPHLRIRLNPQTIGSQLIAINSSGQMGTDEDFVSAFKGLYVKVDASSYASGQGGVYFFSLEDALSKLTLYFHETTDPTTPKEYDFSINRLAARYNAIAFDRTGTVVADQLNAPELGREAFYVQGSGVRAVVELPHINSLYYDSTGNEDRKIINKAELVLPVQDYTAGLKPVSDLFLARMVEDSTFDFTLDYTIFNPSIAYDEEKKEFRFLMTREIQAILNGKRKNTAFRIYPLGFFGSTVERIVFNGPESTLEEKARLEITYTDY